MRTRTAELLGHAAAALSQYNYQSALSLAQEALGNIELNSEEAGLLATALLYSGNAALGCGDILLAEEHLNHAADLFAEGSDTADSLECQIGLAECALRRSDLPRAARALKGIAVQLEEQSWPELQARLQLLQGSLLWMEGKSLEASALLQEAATKMSEPGSLMMFHRMQCSLAVALALEGQEDVARQMLLTALDYFSEVKDAALIARCLNNLAGLAFNQQHWDAARKYLMQCIAIETEAQDRADLAAAWSNLAIIEMRSNNLKLARKYLNRAFQLAQECADRDSEAAALIQLAVLSLLESDCEQALNYSMLSQALTEGLQGTAVASVLNYIPVVLIACNQTDAAALRLSELSLPAGTQAAQALTELLDFILGKDFVPQQPLTAESRDLAISWLKQLYNQLGS